jgi:chemotaxis protein methyltransferase CheR
MKKQILTKIAKESLMPGGYLFVSMNEIASIDAMELPPDLEKVSDGKVFYFRKKFQTGVL